MSEILGESIASVKSRLHRPRMALRELLTHIYASGSAPASTATAMSGGPARNPR